MLPLLLSLLSGHVRLKSEYICKSLSIQSWGEYCRRLQVSCQDMLRSGFLPFIINLIKCPYRRPPRGRRRAVARAQRQQAPHRPAGRIFLHFKTQFSSNYLLKILILSHNLIKSHLHIFKTKLRATPYKIFNNLIKGRLLIGKTTVQLCNCGSNMME